MFEPHAPPHLVDATVNRYPCDPGAPGAARRGVPRPGTWYLHIRYRTSPGAAEERAADLPLSDEFAAFQIDLLLRSIRRGEIEGAALLFACLHEEWGRLRLVYRDAAWDALFTFLAPFTARPFPSAPSASASRAA